MVKKVLKTVVGATLLMGSSMAVAADSGWYAEGQYLSLGADGVDVGGVGVAIGNNFTENLAVEFILGTGMGDDTVDGVKVELDSYYGLILKPNMDVTDKVNVFLNLGYADFDLSASYGNMSASESTDEFLWGIGAQADFTDTLYGTASFLDVGNTDGFRVTIGFKL